jgi:biotin synthase
VELAYTLAELKVDSVPLNFLNAIPGTRLADMTRLAPEEALRTIAMFRLVLPYRNILIAGGRSHVLQEWQSWLYAAGANGMMIGDYLTTVGASFESDHALMHTLGVM